MKAKLISRGNGNYKLYVDEIPYATTDNSPYKRLSKQNCDDLFGIVDINKLMIEDSKDTVIYNESYELGFKRAMELYQPKEIEVEIEMEEFESYDENLDIIKKPKLDENGCLMLKKI